MLLPSTVLELCIFIMIFDYFIMIYDFYYD